MFFFCQNLKGLRISTWVTNGGYIGKIFSPISFSIEKNKNQGRSSQTSGLSSAGSWWSLWPGQRCLQNSPRQTCTGPPSPAQRSQRRCPPGREILRWACNTDQNRLEEFLSNEKWDSGSAECLMMLHQNWPSNLSVNTGVNSLLQWRGNTETFFFFFLWFYERCSKEKWPDDGGIFARLKTDSFQTKLRP